MKNLKVWQKLALMGAVFMVPFAVVTYKMTSSVNTLGTEFGRQEIRGLEYYTPLLALITDVGDASHLTLDPDIDSYYLMKVVIFQGPELSELLAQAHGLGSGMATSRKGSSEQFERLNRLAILVAFLQKQVDQSLSKALQFNPALRPQLEARPRVNASGVQEAAARIFDTSAADYFAAMTRNINAIFDMANQLTGSLNVLLNKRVEKFHREVLYTLASAGLGLLVVSVIGF